MKKVNQKKKIILCASLVRKPPPVPKFERSGQASSKSIHCIYKSVFNNPTYCWAAASSDSGGCGS